MPFMVRPNDMPIMVRPKTFVKTLVMQLSLLQGEISPSRWCKQGTVLERLLQPHFDSVVS